jgi:excisionase family DNA binding protein
MASMEPAQAVRPTGTAAAAITCMCAAPRLFAVEVTASITGTSDEYWYERLRDGRFPGKRLGRSWRVPADFVHGFLAAPTGASLEDFAAAWMAERNEGAA